MLAANKSTVATSIYSAIIINKDTSQDPEQLNRVQLFIPSIHYDYVDIVEEYMRDGNKTQSQYFNVFPWAVSLVESPENGSSVYGSYIDNEFNRYIVLGYEGGSKSSSNVFSLDGTVGTNDIVGSQLLDYTMPIILQNEIGLALSAWTDNNIPDSYYTNITLNDGAKYVGSIMTFAGSFSIGLIQWYAGRAFDLLFRIAQKDSNWQSYFSENCSLINDLKSSIRENSSGKYKGNYTSYNPTKNSYIYNAIKSMLGSSIGKEVQRTLAAEDTASNISLMTDKGINNPAVLIYLADFVNQYGAGYSEIYTNAKKICDDSSKNMIQQLDEVIVYLKNKFSSFSKYSQRRNRTYTYVNNLYSSGKLSTTLLTDLSGNAGTQFTDLGIVLGYPTECKVVTSTYGPRWGSFHKGVDLAAYGGAKGKKIYAAHDGTVQTVLTANSGGYGNLIKLTNGKITTYYAHQDGFATGIKTGITVKRGQLIGYVGNTGDSQGAHLHFEIRVNNQTTDPLPYLKKLETGLIIQ